MPFLRRWLFPQCGKNNTSPPNSGHVVTVPIGFITDFASIPRLFRAFITGNDNTKMPAVLHDYLYRKNIGSRKDADLLFLVAMRENGVPWWKRRMAYAGVRTGGWIAWSQHKNEARK